MLYMICIIILYIYYIYKCIYVYVYIHTGVVNASPMARKLATDNNVDISKVKGWFDIIYNIAYRCNS